MTIYQSPFAAVEIPRQSITDYVLEGVRLSGDRPVLTCGQTGRQITGTGLEGMIRSLAGGLLRRFDAPGWTVALMAPNIPEYAVVFHAVALAGGTITTVNPTYTPDELRYQLNDAQADLLVTIPAFLDTARAAIAGTGVSEIVVIGEAEGATPLSDLMGEPLAEQVPVDLETHVVVLPYSSGTTGLSKGVMLSHRNLVANLAQTTSLMDIAPGETSIAMLPFFHIYGMQVMMNLYLRQGAAQVTLPRFDLEVFLRHIQTHRMERLFVVPPVVIALTRHPMVADHDLSSVRMLLSAAAPLGAELGQACAARIGCQVIQGYGMTELSPVSHFTLPGKGRPGSAGQTVPNTECRIIDTETGADAAPGGVGELWVRGPQVMLGYLRNETASANAVDADGWVRTGDVARFDEDGYLFIVDRVKELIKYKGFQVPPAELEALLQTHPDVADVAVVGIPDDEAGEVPMAFVVLKPDRTPDAGALQDFVAGHVATYKQIRRVAFVDAIPKSASGKILRRVLRAGATQGS